MENENADVVKKEKAAVFKNAFNALSVFVRTLPKNEDYNDDINDIDDLSKFSDEDRETIAEIRKVEAQLKKATNNVGGKKGLYLEKNRNDRAIETRTTIMNTVVNERIEKNERIRG